MNIERNIYVLEDRTGVSQPIDYVQGTNAIPIVFHLRDYNIPDGATAKIYIRKPSGKKEYQAVAIDGNDIVIDVKDTMFSEAGMSYIQCHIISGEKTLATFEYPVNAKRNNASGAATESGDIDNLAALPTITASDNGKILQVVDGQWALVDLSTLTADDGNEVAYV